MTGDVKLEVGGKAYTFVLGTYGLAMLERETGIPTAKFFDRPEDQYGVSELLSVVKAGLARHHPGISEVEVADMIDAYGHEKAGDLVQKAVQAAFPEPKDGDAPPPKPAVDGTGKDSSQTG